MLSTDTSFITAWSNDHGYEDIFRRQLQALANEKDCFVAYSTSGESSNIINAIDYANSKGIKTISFTGSKNSEVLVKSSVKNIKKSTITEKMKIAEEAKKTPEKKKK